LSPSSRVSRAALGLVMYDGVWRVHRGHLAVLVSSPFSPWRHELLVVQQMRHLPARCLGAAEGFVAAVLALGV
jgi:hypothetical protein